MNAKEKVQSFIDTINAKYETSFTDLTTAVLYAVEHGTKPEEYSDPDLSAIVEYFKEQVTDANTWLKAIPDGYYNYIVITDTHYDDNTRNSHAIVKSLWDTGRFTKIFHLGDIVTPRDYLDKAEAAAEVYLEDFGDLKEHMITVFGNHDAQIANCTWDVQMHDNNVTYLQDDKISYYWDDTKAKIRWYCIWYGETGYPSAIYENLKELPDGYQWAIIYHWPAFMMWMNEGSQYVSSATSWQDVATWVACHNDKCVGIFAGHSHNDWYANVVIDDYKADFQHLNFMADWIHSVDAGIPYTATVEKTAGTITEQRVTLLSINPTTKKIRSYAIGACLDEYKEVADFSYAPSHEFPEQTGTAISDYGYKLFKGGSYEYQGSYGISEFIPVHDVTTFTVLSDMTNAINWEYVRMYDEDKNLINNDIGARLTFPTSEGSTLDMTDALHFKYGDSYIDAKYIKICAYVEEFKRFTVTSDIALISISATYTGGSVDAGTSVSNLTGLTVTASYSDGTTEEVTGYTLSPDTIEEGTNTITVTYEGKTCTFTVIGGSSGEPITISYNGTTATVNGLNSINISYNGTTATVGGGD